MKHLETLQAMLDGIESQREFATRCVDDTNDANELAEIAEMVNQYEIDHSMQRMGTIVERVQRILAKKEN